MEQATQVEPNEARMEVSKEAEQEERNWNRPRPVKDPGKRGKAEDGWRRPLCPFALAEGLNTIHGTSGEWRPNLGAHAPSGHTHDLVLGLGLGCHSTSILPHIGSNILQRGGIRLRIVSSRVVGRPITQA